MSLLSLLGNGAKATVDPGTPDPGPNPGGGQPAPPAAPTVPGSFDYTINPGDNLTTIAAGAPAGSTFLIKNGTHSGFSQVVVKSGDQFWGESRAGAIIDGSSYGGEETGRCFTGRTQSLGGSNDAVITRMTLQNFGQSTSSSQQAAIYGKEVTWGDGDSMPFRWRIHDVTVQDCGQVGIQLGNDFTVTSCSISGNNRQGINGYYAAGGLIQNCSIFDNAIDPATGSGDDGAGIKCTNINQRGPLIPMGPVKQFKIIGNNVSNNRGRGIWFDIDCHEGYVGYNTVSDTNGLFGIMFELSNNNLAEFNTVSGAYGNLGAGWAGSTNFGMNGALSACESHNITFQYNTVDGANHGFVNRLSARGRAEGVGDFYPDVLIPRGELINSHAAITDPNAIANIGTSNNSCIGNTFIDVDRWGDHYGVSHAGLGHPTTHTYTGNDITGSPGIVHYYDGVAMSWPGNGRT